MKIENLENLQEINPEEFSSLQGGMETEQDPVIFYRFIDMIDMKGEIKDVRINFSTRFIHHWNLIK